METTQKLIDNTPTGVASRTKNIMADVLVGVTTESLLINPKRDDLAKRVVDRLQVNCFSMIKHIKAMDSDEITIRDIELTWVSFVNIYYETLNILDMYNFIIDVGAFAENEFPALSLEPIETKREFISLSPIEETPSELDKSV